jgi:hypothetical protein
MIVRQFKVNAHRARKNLFMNAARCANFIGDSWTRFLNVLHLTNLKPSSAAIRPRPQLPPSCPLHLHGSPPAPDGGEGGGLFRAAALVLKVK